MTVPLADRFRRPEYTGENRCLPCTVLNVAIAGLAGAAVAVVAPLAAGLAVLAASLLVIYLRGYLVPGTPTLTGRYLPERVHDALGTRATSADDQNWETLEKLENHRENRIEPASFLAERGVVSEGADGWGLVQEFRERVSGHVAELDETGLDRETIADVYGADAGDVAALDDDHPAFEVGRHVRRWPSETAVRTHVAMDGTLREWTDDWADVPVEQRQRTLEAMRSLLSSCPSCGGAVSETTEPVESCCYGGELHSVYCEDCGDRLHEYDPQTVALSPSRTA